MNNNKHEKGNMLKRHDSQLWVGWTSSTQNGITFISFGEVYHWYNIRRLAKAPWRDLKARLEEL